MQTIYKIIDTTDNTLIGKTFTVNFDAYTINIIEIEHEQRRSSVFETIKVNGDVIILQNANFMIKGKKI